MTRRKAAPERGGADIASPAKPLLCIWFAIAGTAAAIHTEAMGTPLNGNEKRAARRQWGLTMALYLANYELKAREATMAFWGQSSTPR